MRKHYEAIWRILEKCREELRLHMDEHRHVLRETLPGDLEEQSTFAVVIEQALVLVDDHSQQIQEIEEALKRLKNGTYGNCKDCGETIPQKRLDALPFALRCRDCQEVADEVRPAGSPGATYLGVPH